MNSAAQQRENASDSSIDPLLDLIPSTNSDAGPSRFKQRILAICQKAKPSPGISSLILPRLTTHTNSTPPVSSSSTTGAVLAPTMRAATELCKSPAPSSGRPNCADRETVYIAALLSIAYRSRSRGYWIAVDRPSPYQRQAKKGRSHQRSELIERTRAG